MDLKRVQQSAHHTMAKLPIGDADGKLIFEDIDIWFRPLSVAMLQELEAANTDDNRLSLVEAKAMTVAKQLVRWSVTSDGQPVEPTYEVLKTLNRLQLDALLAAINDYTFPKETT